METIILSAIRIDNNVIAIALHPKSRHCNIINSLVKSGQAKPIKGEQGFLTSTGRFVNRIEAKEIAIKSGQIIPHKMKCSTLTSEDLW